MSRFTRWLRLHHALRHEPRPLADRFRRARSRYLTQSASQFGQDFWVLAETDFKRGGFFVEFGAHDGVFLSNTLLLEREFDWRGILAEPNPRFSADMAANRKARICDKCVYSQTGQRIEFWDVGDDPALSTTAAHAANDHFAATRENSRTRIVVETISLNDMLTEFEAPPVIDYVSVDTEGSELEILSAFNFSKWQVRLIGVECNNPKNEPYLDGLMASAGYERVFRRLSPVDRLYRLTAFSR